MAFLSGKNGRLTFEAVSYIDEALFKARESAAVEHKTDVLVGRLDRPIQGALAAPAAGEQRPLSASTAGAQTANPSFGLQGQPSGTLTPPATPMPPAAGFAPTASPTDPAGAGRRRRRTKAEIEADNARAAGGQAPNPPAAPQGAAFGGGNAGPAPFRPADPPAEVASFGIAAHAVAPDPAMTKMLDGIFGKPAA